MRKRFCLGALGVVFAIGCAAAWIPEAARTFAATEEDAWMLSLGEAAPDFRLPDVVTGETVALGDFSDKEALLVMFLCRSCPFVQHVTAELARLGRDYADRDIGIVGISANDPERFPLDAPERLKEMAEGAGLPFPFLFDESQEVAKAYTGAYTPDFFLFNAERRLVYRGQLDGSRPGNGVPLTGEDLRRAIDLVLAGETVPGDQTPSFGCSIKWKKGNTPEYFR